MITSATAAMLALSFMLTLTGCDQSKQEKQEEGKVTLTQQTGATTTVPQIFSYYFPKQDGTCTALIDFHTQPELTTEVEKDTNKSSKLVQQMAHDFITKGIEKCANAKTVTLMAVRIDATDNYGRPDFKNRVNILKITAPLEKIKDLATKPADVATLKQQFGLSF